MPLLSVSDPWDADSVAELSEMIALADRKKHTKRIQPATRREADSSAATGADMPIAANDPATGAASA